ncbi:MAG TPA: hypothetical protein P5133_03580, partial [Spirochaetia bacterium]|nr:hypothetical protein [Spirochaetia bacterium]
MNHPERADLILRSSSIFTAAGAAPMSGYVAVRGERILSAGAAGEAALLGPGTRILELGSRTVCPGFTDAHCFFAGHAMGLVGIDLAGVDRAEGVLELAGAAAGELAEGKPLLGRGLRPGLVEGRPGAELEAA